MLKSIIMYVEFVNLT